MNKLEAIEIAKLELKKLGFKKTRNHWILLSSDYYIAFNIQGSQWNKDDYYINFSIDNVNNYNGKPISFTPINERFFSTKKDENNDGQVCPDIYEALKELKQIIDTYFKQPINQLIQNNEFIQKFKITQAQLDKLVKLTRT